MADAATARRSASWWPIWEDLDFLHTLWTSGGRPEPDSAKELCERVLTALRGRKVNVEAGLVS